MADLLIEGPYQTTTKLKDLGGGVYAPMVSLEPASIGGAAGASLVTTASGTAARQVLVDPITGNASLVQAFHNTDNQVVSGTSYGLFTGGVDQIINGSGNLDRKRGVAGDAMAITGLAAEAPMLWNGTTFDRQRGNSDATLATLAAASAGASIADQLNGNGRGVQIGINITAITGTTPSLTVTVQGKDVASGVYYTLLASAALTATGFTLLTVYPAAPTTANVSSPQVLPRTWRVTYAIAGTIPAVTATIGASVIV